MKPIAKFLGLAFLPMAAIVLIGCSSDKGSASNSTPQAETSAVSSASGQVVSVELSEYTVQVNDNTAPHGDITFDVKNDGTLAHQFVVIQTDLPGDQLPLDGNTGKVDLNSDKLKVDYSHDAIPPGENPKISVNLPAGHYVLICNLPGHYERGMHYDFVASGNVLANTPVP